MRRASRAFRSIPPDTAKFSAFNFGGKAPLAKRRESVKGGCDLFSRGEKPRDRRFGPVSASVHSVTIITDHVKGVTINAARNAE